jgi:hypothetical protein
LPTKEKVKNWNVMVTVAPGRQSRLLGRPRRLGDFERAEFKNVCSGYVQDVAQFLEALRFAHKNDEPWMDGSGWLQRVSSV